MLDQAESRIPSFEDFYASLLAKGYRIPESVARRIYRNRYGASPTTIRDARIGDVTEGEVVRLKGLVVRKFRSTYQGCPENLKKAPCPDGTIADIIVYRVELADTESGETMFAFTITPEPVRELEDVEPGDTVELVGRVVRRKRQDGREELQLNIYRRQGVRVIERLADDIIPPDNEGTSQEPETGAQAIEDSNTGNDGADYNSNTGPESVELTEQERKLLEQIAKAPNGFHIDLVRAIARKLGIERPIEELPGVMVYEVAGKKYVRVKG